MLSKIKQQYECSGVGNVWRARYLLPWGCCGQGWPGGEKIRPQLPPHSISLQVIIEVNDCALNLMGESQEEDRRQIAEMVLKKMEAQCLPAIHTNGVESKNLLEKSSEGDLKSGESKEKTSKSLPGPIQRGPQRRINNSQGRIHLSSNVIDSIVVQVDISVFNHLSCRLLRFNRLDAHKNCFLYK